MDEETHDDYTPFPDRWDGTSALLEMSRRGKLLTVTITADGVTAARTFTELEAEEFAGAARRIYPTSDAERQNRLPLEIVEAFKAGAKWCSLNGADRWRELDAEAKHYAMTGEIKDH